MAGTTGGGRNGLADVAQLVERVLGKDEVSGSIPLIGSRKTVAAGGVGARARPRPAATFAGVTQW